MKIAELFEAKEYNSPELSVTHLTRKQTHQILTRYCGDAVNSVLRGGVVMWRGFHEDPTGDEEGSAVLINTSLSTRRSENTSNWYTSIIDNSPAFNGWPKRSKSIICSANWDRAVDYSNCDPYLILPYDNAKLACVNERDIWDTRLRLLGERVKLNWVNDMLTDFRMIIARQPSRPDFPDNWEGFLKLCDEVADIANLRNGYTEAVRYKVLDKAAEISPNFVGDSSKSPFANKLIENLKKHVLDALTPEGLGFSQHSSLSKVKYDHDNEWWIEGQSIAVKIINEEDARSVLEDLLKPHY